MPSAKIESTTTVDLSPTQFFQIPYYSPGLYCPADWVTVGVASWNGDDRFSSGVLKPTKISEKMAPGELLLDVLDKSETAVLCCPKSFSAHLSYGCYSTISDYKPSSACNWEVPKGDIKFSTFAATINGTATSRYIQVPASTSDFVGPTTTTFDKEDKETMAGIAVQRIVTMIHKKDDFDDAGPTNQAVRFTPGSVWSGIGPVIGISVAAMGLGAAMILL